MGNFIPPSEGILDYEASELIKDFYRYYQLNHFILDDINDQTPMITEVQVKANMIRLGSEVTKQMDVRMVKEDNKGFDDPNGEWYVVDWPTLG